MRAIAILDLVQRLLTLEAAESQTQDSRAEEFLVEAAERVSGKLRTHLSQRIGQEGFQTLLARALTLTTAQFPHLNAVRVEPDGSLIGLRGAARGCAGLRGAAEGTVEAGATVEGAIALIAQFLGLLITFIGANLTQRILSTIWPHLAWDDLAGWENETP